MGGYVLVCENIYIIYVYIYVYMEVYIIIDNGYFWVVSCYFIFIFFISRNYFYKQKYFLFISMEYKVILILKKVIM